eukprot:scaffold142959_cov70-Attheya_sp.AAC.1
MDEQIFHHVLASFSNSLRFFYPVAGSSRDGVSEQPSVNGHSTEQVVESDFVGKEKEVNFGTDDATSDRGNEAVFTATSTLVSETLDTEFSVSASVHDANVGTGSDFENDTDQIILSSQNDMILYANFADQLDCNVESTDSNLLDLDDLDIFLEETNL